MTTGEIRKGGGGSDKRDSWPRLQRQRTVTRQSQLTISAIRDYLISLNVREGGVSGGERQWRMSRQCW